MLPDLSNVDDDRRLVAAERVRRLKDFQLPELEWFNSEPCGQHGSLEEGMSGLMPCQVCGIRLRKHQRVGVAWLYLVKQGLIGDSVGTGKSAQAAGLLAAMKQMGELEDGRAVIVVRPSALAQWHEQLQRLIPKIQVTAATGTKPKRIEKYVAPWEVLLIGFHMFVRDRELLENFPIRTLITDDVDALRNPANQVSYAIKFFAKDCDRAVVLNGTPMQKRLLEMYSVMEPIGGQEIFGSETAFRRNYLREEWTKYWDPRAATYRKKRELVGYQNLDQFKQVIAPKVLRRTADDIDDVDLPSVISNNVFVELHPLQKRRYAQLKKKALQIVREGEVKLAKASATFLYGAQICAGLVVLGEPDGPGTSVKLDWVVDKVVDGDLSEEKIVVFIHNRLAIAALQARLDTTGTQYVTISGADASPKARWAAQDRFWKDPGCRILIGSTSIEQSLNLQIARHLINVDTIMNAKRMEQLMGRIRRAGSAHKSVYVHNLLALGTQEEGYADVLKREAALSDHVWEDQVGLFEALSPMELVQLIGRFDGP